MNYSAHYVIQIENELKEALKHVEELERELKQAELDRDYWEKCFYDKEVIK